MNQQRTTRPPVFLLPLLLLLVMSLLGNMQTKAGYEVSDREMTELFREEQVKSFTIDGDVLQMQLHEPYAVEEESYEQVWHELYDFQFFYDTLHELVEEQAKAGIIEDYNYEGFEEESWVADLIPYLIMAAALFFLFNIMMSRNGGNNGMAKFGTARTKTKEDYMTHVTFADVAGAKEEKEELFEIVDFLKNPKKYNDLGARIPHGVLLVGPPGTGKTLLAKAVAGEAGVGFLSISGSDFVEMDGFGSNQGVVVLAATNRADILDPALLRPGRFDRQVYVGLPDIQGREEILQVHTKKKPLAEDVDLRTVARGTAGFTGADLENLANEAALLAARRNDKFVRGQDMKDAVIKVIAGPEKKSRVITEAERKLTAYHEAGHALVIHALPSQDPVHQITIIPRGQAGGMTIHLPTEDRSYRSRTEMRDEIAVCLGGRAAEELVLGDISTGAGSDLQRASSLARSMVMRYGMSERLGNVVYDSGGSEVFIGRSMAQTKSYSETVAAEIDTEVKMLVDAAYAKAEEILTEKREKLDAVAQYLLENETMEAEEFLRMMEE